LCKERLSLAAAAHAAAPQQPPVRQQQRLVEERERLERGRVQGAEHGAARLRQRAQRAHQRQSVAGVKSSGGLVQKERGGADRQLGRDGCAPPLAAGEQAN